MSGDRPRRADLAAFPPSADARLERIYHQWKQGRLREPGVVRETAQGRPELDVLVELDPAVASPPFLKLSRADDRARVRAAAAPVEMLARLGSHEAVVRVEAARRLRPQLAYSVPELRATPAALAAASPSRPACTGAGVVIGVVDVGCDVAHPNFRNPDQSSRILHLWRQGAPPSPESPPEFGYGKAYDRATIDAALAAGDPYGPSMGSVKPRPASHGTHVLDIAAGNGRAPGTHAGVAPGADIVFVDVAPDVDREEDLGSSARLVHAARYVFLKAEALGRPAVVNVSLGANGGAHDGSSLVDRGLADLLDRPGRAITIAAGNAFEAGCHAAGEIKPGTSRSLTWLVQPQDETGNELEVWYSGGALEVFLTEPNSGFELGPVALDAPPAVFDLGGLFCRVHHKTHDAASGVAHVDIFLDWPPVAGAWTVRLANGGRSAASFDAWIERDDGSNAQSVFAATDVETKTTLSTLACGPRPIVVGAYGSGELGQLVADFSAAGPTRTGKPKPDVSAPGQYDDTRGVEAACSRTQGLTRFAGTSQAAPHVAGVIALMFEAAPRLPDIDEVRQILASTARSAPTQVQPQDGRAGAGRVDAAAAVAAAHNL